MTIVTVLIGVLLGSLRVAGVKSMFFQGVAHIFVGGLGGAWLVGRRRLHAALFIGLTILEIACFLLLTRPSPL